MEKRMEAITVVTDDNGVWIKTADYGDGTPEVFIPAEQLDFLLEWLHEARLEFEDK